VVLGEELILHGFGSYWYRPSSGKKLICKLGLEELYPKGRNNGGNKLGFAQGWESEKKMGGIHRESSFS